MIAAKVLSHCRPNTSSRSTYWQNKIDKKFGITQFKWNLGAYAVVLQSIHVAWKLSGMWNLQTQNFNNSVLNEIVGTTPIY